MSNRSCPFVRVAALAAALCASVSWGRAPVDVVRCGAVGPWCQQLYVVGVICTVPAMMSMRTPRAAYKVSKRANWWAETSPAFFSKRASVMRGTGAPSAASCCAKGKRSSTGSVIWRMTKGASHTRRFQSRSPVRTVLVRSYGRCLQLLQPLCFVEQLRFFAEASQT